MFGSAATERLPAGSHVAVLCVLRDGVHLGWAMSDDGEQLLNWPVDLVAKRALHDRPWDAVVAEAQVGYAA